MSPQTPRPSQSTSTARSGFSLIELMVVIVVISILMALILPAIGNVSNTAKIAQVQVEIRSFETGITNFKQEFGIDPPAHITLHEDPTGWGGSVRSQTLIRRMWPQFNFGLARDINGDGDQTDAIELTGSECLVFFLGGMVATNIVDAAGATGTPGRVTEWTPLGFSKNPRNPFERGGGTRIGPFQEFDGARLVNIFSITGTGAGNDHDMPEYLDTLPSQSNPYLYASSYDGKGYHAEDLGGPGLASLSPPRTPVTTMTNVYLQKLGASALGNVEWNQTGFQIISPGFDTEYGIGGLYESDGLLDPTTRGDEQDNITNFSSAQLEN